MRRYSVSLATLFYNEGKANNCYFILYNNVPVFEINRWLEYKCNFSERTSRQYAYNLCRFLNYIDKNGKSYLEATKFDVLNYIDSILFSNEGHTLKMKSELSYNTACSYLTTIKQFYRYLEDYTEDKMNIAFTKKRRKSTKHSYLHGQIWHMEIKEFLGNKIARIKETKSYIKWYTEEEIEAILSNFSNIRDKVVFLLTLEGMRIDEVISLTVDCYNANEEIITTNRTKRNKPRVIPIKKRTAKMIDDYLYTERNLVECETGILNNDMFINLREGKSRGKIISYRNILSIMKNAAVRAGLDINGIRTHSGRSTRTMELLHYQAEHPGNITDEQIRILMGWSSSKSMEPYINFMDERLMISSAKKINGFKNNETESNN